MYVLEGGMMVKDSAEFRLNTPLAMTKKLCLM